MISVVMPYWQRPDALRANVAKYCELYKRDDVELIVVDDGSPEHLVLGKDLSLDVVVVRLPRKDVALNPCVPINIGAARAKGDVIVLTNPEVVHRGAILGPMLDTLSDLGPKGYVAAACRSRGIWLCHSTGMPSDRMLGRASSPPGAGLHFCSMLRRSLFEEVGGFTEEYRDGQGYDDNDFLWKLHAAGARFAIRDDLVCDHIICPPSSWPEGGAKRNKAIYERRLETYQRESTHVSA